MSTQRSVHVTFFLWLPDPGSARHPQLQNTGGPAHRMVPIKGDPPRVFFYTAIVRVPWYLYQKYFWGASHPTIFSSRFFFSESEQLKRPYPILQPMCADSSIKKANRTFKTLIWLCICGFVSSVFFFTAWDQRGRHMNFRVPPRSPFCDQLSKFGHSSFPDQSPFWPQLPAPRFACNHLERVYWNLHRLDADQAVLLNISKTGFWVGCTDSLGLFFYF